MNEDSLKNTLMNIGVDDICSANFNFLRFALPKDDYGDWLFAFILFARVHKRVPTNDMLLNDFVFRLKTSEEGKNPLRAFVTDKEFIKDYVSAVVGDAYNVPTIGVIKDSSLLDNYLFPENCCIKPTHLSGLVFLRKLNEEISIAQLKQWMTLNFYDMGREIQYKLLKPKIIIEPFIFNQTNLIDYKFHCYHGKPNLVQVDIDRHINHTRLLFDSNWNNINIFMSRPRCDYMIEKPENFSEMKFVASKLSKKFDYVRVDMYSNGKQCVVGEITNTPASGTEMFSNREDEKKISDIIFS